MKKILILFMTACVAMQICRASIGSKGETAANSVYAAEVPNAEDADAEDADPELTDPEYVDSELYEVEPEPEGIFGAWKLIETASGGEVCTSREELEKTEAGGKVTYLEFYRDGTAVFSAYGVDMDASWDEDTVTIEGREFAYTLDETVLELQDGTDTMKFEWTRIESLYAILGYREGVLDEEVLYSDEEVTILDTEDAAVTITGYMADRAGFTVSVLCENRTDHNMMISMGKSVINKYAIDPSWNLSLEKGETRDSMITYSPSDLQKCGIVVVDELILSMKVVDCENWNVLADDVVAAVYPTGRKPEEIKAADRIHAEGEVKLVSNDDCAFVLQGAGEDPLPGYAVDCYYRNKTDKVLIFRWADTSVDDRKMPCCFVEEVLPGTRGYTKVVFPAAFMEKKKVRDVKEIRATLQVYEKDESGPVILLEKEFTYQPK